MDNAGSMHWQLGGMRPSDGNSQRWVLGEVDGNTIKFTVRNGSNEIVANECFTLTTPAEEYQVSFGTVNGNGQLTASVDGVAISTGAQVQKGKSVVFTAVPAEGFKLKEWKLNGVAVAETSTTYTLSDLSAAATVSVDFEIVTGTGNSFADNLQVYPNPFTDVVNIKGAGNGALQIMDVAGTKKKKKNIRNFIVV